VPQPSGDTQEFAVIYIKSVLVGLLALAVVFIVLPILGVILYSLYSLTHTPPEGGSIGWDPISLVKQSPLVPSALVVFIFALGFLWEFRRLTPR